MSRSELPDAFNAFRVTLEGETVKRGLQRVGADTLPPASPVAGQAAAPRADPGPGQAAPAPADAETAAGSVTIAVAFSSLNYKDALSASGNRGVTRSYPHTPGIDAAGTVVDSGDPRYAPGDEVVCTGFDLGMNTPGGWAEYVRVPADWLVHLPAGLDLRASMALGTAGVTAQLAIERLESVGLEPELGPVVVTGASGGVGSLAVALLAARGYEVVASSGTPGAHGLLTRLGANRVVPREELGTEDRRPLGKAEFAGGVDTVGGVTLANLLKRTRIGGAVAACGLVGGAELPVGVFPFILRGVSLLGVDSQHLPKERRVGLWSGLADAWRDHLAGVEGLVAQVGLGAMEEKIESILAGGVVGRVVVATG